MTNFNFFQLLTKAETLYNKAKEITSDVKDGNYVEMLRDLSDFMKELADIFSAPLPVKVGSTDDSVEPEFLEAERKFRDLTLQVPTVSQLIRSNAVQVRAMTANIKPEEVISTKFGPAEIAAIAQLVELTFLVVKMIRERRQSQK